MNRAWVVALVGCGRLGFDAGDNLGAPLDACEWGPWGTPRRLQESLQSPVDDWGGTVSADGLELFYFSYRPGGVGNADIYHAVRASVADAWSPPSLISSIATPMRESSPTVTADRLELLFAVGSSSIWVTRRASISDLFGSPSPVLELDGVGAEDAPFITPDGLRLVYVVRSPASRIMEATRRDRASAFGAPVQLIEPIGNGDHAPSLTGDGLELIFTSNQRGGTGGWDLFTTRRSALDQPFGPITRIVELASVRDDVDPRLTDDGALLYLAYDTVNDGGANADLWVASRACP